MHQIIRSIVRKQLKAEFSFAGKTHGGEKEKLQTAALQAGDKQAVVASVAGHERIHATDNENVKQSNFNNKQGANFDFEKAPVARETQILKNAVVKDAFKNILLP